MELAKLTARSVTNTEIRKAVLAITNDLPARDDASELEAIFEAVKFGTPLVPGLEAGLRYVSDPIWSDYFTAPHRLIELCRAGSCGGDCDDHAALIGAMCGAIGYQVGMRAWGPEDSDSYSHVYCVVGYPKRSAKRAVALDTTVDESSVGWEPPGKNILTAWIED